MKLAVPTETRPGERRVALVPDVVKKLAGAGWEITVQSGAGTEAAFSDSAYPRPVRRWPRTSQPRWRAPGWWCG